MDKAHHLPETKTNKTDYKQIKTYLLVTVVSNEQQTCKKQLVHYYKILGKKKPEGKLKEAFQNRKRLFKNEQNGQTNFFKPATQIFKATSLIYGLPERKIFVLNL